MFDRVFDPKILVSIRASRGLTRSGLAERSGVSRATIFRIETELQNPRLVTLEKLMKPLGRPVDILFVRRKGRWDR